VENDEDKKETVTIKKITFNGMTLYDTINSELKDSYFKL